MFSRRAALAGVAALALLSAPAFADGIRVDNAWARATAPGAPTGAVYLTLANGGGTADALTGATTPAAERVDIHGHEMSDGVAHMHALTEIAVPAGGTATLAPGSRHLMLAGLRQRLVEGARFPLTLSFAKAAPVTVEVTVRGAGAR